ncbi:hypothetical protein DI041_04025 [Stenotrophomonas maltophilia]|uniref:hypothetical protein n=1 Tax=Stenotrophomonas maltophilia TaxID=40324 RepID=UPI0010AAC914|nr:hypothetical protein [Stenotrophomonas maltophilia]TIE20996.1 hypothetical protein DI034_02105 [Stenotrophomonas maltophilia]TIE64493.1 hypothetical protein DI041_04025 [Stenotrophomonas maltophilia]
MAKVIALTSFEHHGSRGRGAEFGVSTQHADLLVKRGLVKLAGQAAAAGGDSTAATGRTSEGAQLVRQKAADAIAAIAAVTDLELLAAALKAETTKGDKARATVVEAIETGINAATLAQA